MGILLWGAKKKLLPVLYNNFRLFSSVLKNSYTYIRLNLFNVFDFFEHASVDNIDLSHWANFLNYIEGSIIFDIIIPSKDLTCW